MLGRRPVISKPRKLALVARAALGKLSDEQRRYSKSGRSPLPSDSQLQWLTRVPGHHARRRQEFLLRIPGAAAREARRL